MIAGVAGALKECTGFRISISRAPVELPAEPGDTAKRFEPGPETIYTITVRHDDNPPPEFVRNPNYDVIPAPIDGDTTEPETETEHDDRDGSGPTAAEPCGVAE